MDASPRRSTGRLLTAANALAPARGRPRTVEHSTLVDVALRVVDEEDLGALTMRRLADELGVGVATVYAVAGGKDQLLNDLVEHILAEVPDVTVDAQRWESGIVDTLAAVHDVFISHPGVAHLALLRRITGEAALRTQETILLLLRAGGVEERQLATAYTTLTSYVMGFTMLQISRMADAGRVDVALQQFPRSAFPEVHAFAPTLDRQTSREGFLEGLRHVVHSFAYPKSTEIRRRRAR